MKKATMPQWQQNPYQKPNIPSFVLWCITAEILLLSGLYMLYDVFPEMKLKGADFICLEILAFVIAFAYEFAVPLLGQKGGAAWGVAGYCALPFVAAFGFWFYYHRNMEELNPGFLSIGNMYLEKLNPYYKVNFSLPVGDLRMLSSALCFGIGLLLFLLLGFAGASRKRGWMILFPLLILGGELAVGYAPGWQGLSLFFLGGLLCGAGSGCGGLIGKRQKGKERSRLKAAAVQGILLLAAVILLALVPALFGGAAESLAARGDSYKEFQNELENIVASFSWDRLVGDRQTVSNQKPAYADRVALVVTADERPQENLYLREFYGTEYNNGTWIQTKDNFERGCRENGIDIEEGQRYLAGAFYDYLANQEIFGQEGTSVVNYRISYEQRMGSSALFPYYVDTLGEKGRKLEGDFLVKKGVFTGETAMSAVSFLNESAAYRLLFADAEIQKCQENWDEEGRKFFQWYNGYAADYTTGSETVPRAGELGQQLTDGGVSWMWGVSAYQMWELDTAGTSSNAFRYFMAQEAAAYLKGNCSYRLDLDRDTKGKDVVEYFLSESNEGYCMHFASAGALILQEMGIPARYVSGYIVKPGSFEIQEDGSYQAKVLDNCSHAWVEIYLDNLGWFPVEMTPGYDGGGRELPSQQEEPREQGTNSSAAGEESESSQQQENSSQDTEETEEPQEESEENLPDNEESPEPAGKENEEGTGGSKAGWNHFWNRYGNLLKAVFRMNMVIRLVTVLLLWGWKVICGKIRRRYVLIRQDMGRGNYAKAVRRMNRFLYRRLYFKGRFVNQKATDGEYLKALAENYPEQTKEQWELFVQLAQKAAYSKGDMTKEEADIAAEIFFTACKPLQSN